MNKNDAEAVIKETIEYANREIEITKKKARRNIIIVISCLVLLIAAGVGAIVNHNLKDNSNKKVTQKEIYAARDTASRYVSRAYDAVRDEEWFADSAYVGGVTSMFEYSKFRNPYTEYKEADDNDSDKEITIVQEETFNIYLYFANKDNEIVEYEVHLTGSIVEMSDTGEIIDEFAHTETVGDEVQVLSIDEFNDRYNEMRRKGYLVSDDSMKVQYFIEAD